MPATTNRLCAKTKLERMSTFVLAAVASLSLTLFVAGTIRALYARGPIWFEGPVLGFLYNLHTGRIYQMDALHAAPYSVLTHPPLSYMLDYAVNSIFPDVRSLRVVNIVLTMGCAALVGKLTSLETGNRVMAPLFGACIFLGSIPIFFWSQVARCPDSLSCLFSLGVLTALTKMRKSIHREVVVGIFLALAVLSKQTALVVLTPTLIAQSVYFERNWRSGLGRFLVAAAIVVPVFVLLQWTSHGGFYENVVGGNLVRMSFAWWLSIMLRMRGFWLFCLGVLLLGGIRKSVVSTWFLSSLAFGLFAAAKRGSDTMYFFDTSAALAILAATLVASRPELTRVVVAAALVPGILAMLVYDLHRTIEITTVRLTPWSMRPNAFLAGS